MCVPEPMLHIYMCVPESTCTALRPAHRGDQVFVKVWLLLNSYILLKTEHLQGAEVTRGAGTQPSVLAVLTQAGCLDLSLQCPRHRSSHPDNFNPQALGLIDISSQVSLWSDPSR